MVAGTTAKPGIDKKQASVFKLDEIALRVSGIAVTGRQIQNDFKGDIPGRAVFPGYMRCFYLCGGAKCSGRHKGNNHQDALGY